MDTAVNQIPNTASTIKLTYRRHLASFDKVQDILISLDVYKSLPVAQEVLEHLEDGIELIDSEIDSLTLVRRNDKERYDNELNALLELRSCFYNATSELRQWAELNNFDIEFYVQA
jgi:hypothetical protein